MEATKDQQLDHFVMYSSIASLIGLTLTLNPPPASALQLPCCSNQSICSCNDRLSLAIKSAELKPLISHNKISKIVQPKLHCSASSSGTKSNIASTLSLSPHADRSCINILCKTEIQTEKCKSNPHPDSVISAAAPAPAVPPLLSLQHPLSSLLRGQLSSLLGAPASFALSLFLQPPLLLT